MKPCVRFIQGCVHEVGTMQVYTLKCEMLAKCSLQETFEVFEDPYNLAKITPAWLNFHVASEFPVIMRKGAEIEYQIRWMGVPIHWKTVIVEYEPPFLFVDEQAKGPYALWRHHHTFEPVLEGTKVRDRVEYALPFGPLGKLVHTIAVRKQLEQIFRYRQEQLTKIFEGRAIQTEEPLITG